MVRGLRPFWSAAVCVIYFWVASRKTLMWPPTQTPEQLRQLFRNCRLIGRRFRLAHIMFGRDIVEVATFRGHHQESSQSQNIAAQSEAGMLLRDNVYGTIDEDAERRDFTINAMYYNIADYSIHDYLKRHGRSGRSFGAPDWRSGNALS